MRMTQVAPPVATADKIDGGGWLFQFHFEGSHEGIFGHHGHAMARAVDLDADGELIVGHGGVFLVAAITRQTVTIVRRRFAAVSSPMLT
jgi:hypothetical protein